jgi:hypothetical protein
VYEAGAGCQRCMSDASLRQGQRHVRGVACRGMAEASLGEACRRLAEAWQRLAEASQRRRLQRHVRGVAWRRPALLRGMSAVCLLRKSLALYVCPTCVSTYYCAKDSRPHLRLLAVSSTNTDKVLLLYYVCAT